MRDPRRTLGPALPLALLLAVLIHAPIVLWMSASLTRTKAPPAPSASTEFMLESPPLTPPPKASEAISGFRKKADPVKPPTDRAPAVVQEPEPDPVKSPPRFSSGLLSQQIAEISSTLVRSKQAPSDGLRVVHASGALGHSAVLEAYEAALSQKIEQVGRLNYPDAAKTQHLEGRIRVSIAIRRDGSLYATRILNASGQALLDQGALQIVRLAAPFAPLPEVLLDQLDVLVITRTIQFDDQSRVSSH